MKIDKTRFSSAQLIPLSFIAAILVGTCLLLLPFSTARGEHTDLLTALFTATTSVCVTGLVVVDTFAHWTLFGKIVILILIQLGGLGIITVTSALMLMLRKKFSMRDSLLLHDAFNLNSTTGLVKFLRRVLKGTFIVEGIGALLYMTVFIPEFGTVKGIWESVFTAISAFCNAGIDILGPDSLIRYQDSPIVLLVTMMLIILGGLGYLVWFDIASCGKHSFRKHYSFATMCRRLNEHTKLVLVLTAFLIFFSAGLILIMEYNNPETIGNMSFGGKVLNSLFQSVTFRTAGFATVPQQALTDASSLLGCLLMFIGGSPVGTAGGVKTVVFFVIVVNVFSFIRNREQTVIFGRQVTPNLVRKANAIVTVCFFVIFVLLVAMLSIERIPMLDALYEVVSAVGTVGLSRGITSQLHTAGRIFIIIGMYLGRIGPISMALFFNSSSGGQNKIRIAEGRFIVG